MGIVTLAHAQTNQWTKKGCLVSGLYYLKMTIRLLDVAQPVERPMVVLPGQEEEGTEYFIQMLNKEPVTQPGDVEIYRFIDNNWIKIELPCVFIGKAV